MKRIFTLIFAVFTSTSFGQIVTYNMSGLTGSETNVSPSSTAANATASNLSRGSGLTRMLGQILSIQETGR